MKYIGELLILTLLFIVNSRVFFPKNDRRDSLVATSPLALLLALLLILSWGLDIFSLATLLLSLLVLLTNFHALFRYKDRLYVDRYSGLMKFWAVITSLSVISLFVIICIFLPAITPDTQKGVTKTVEKYYGNHKNGFEKANNFNHVNAECYEFSLLPGIDKKNVILFLPDRRGDVEAYLPYLNLLARNACTTYTADFYTNDCRYIYPSLENKIFRKTLLIIESLRKPQQFASSREFYTYNMMLEGESLISLAKAKYGPDCRYFLVSDVMGKTAISDLQKKYPELISGIFSLDSIEDYTSPGYGFIEQTNPLLARYLGKEKESDALIPRLAAKKTIAEAKKSWGIKQK